MNILAGMTTNRTHITAKGAPTPFAEKLNKLVVDSLATISKVMKKEFRGFSFGKFRVTYFECDDSGEYLTLYVNGDDTRAQPVIQIRSDEYKRVLRVIPWVYDLEEEDEDYYNKQQGEIKYEDISDIAKSLEYALFNSNVTPFSTSEFKREVGKLAKYLQKEIGSKINSYANLTAGKVTKKKVVDRFSRNALGEAHNELEKWAGGYMSYSAPAVIQRSNFEGLLVIPIRVPSYRKDRRITGVLKVEHGYGNCLDGSIEVRDLDTRDVFKCSIESSVSDTPKMFIDSLEDFLSYHYFDDKSEKSIRSVLFDYADRIGFFDEDEEDY